MPDTETCPKCKAVYEVTLVHLGMRDKDSFECDVCGHRINQWNASTIPNYKLIKKPDKWPTD